MSDVVVIGAGLSGLVSALLLREAGAEVTLVAKGIGGLQLGQGTVDVLGYAPGRVTHPYKALADWVGQQPAHPYGIIGADAVRRGVEEYRRLLGDLVGDGETNLVLPTAVGALRPTLLAPASMADGQVRDDDRVLVVGLAQLKDFYAGLVADNLARQLPASFRHVTLDLAPRGEADASSLTYARRLDDAAFRADLVRLIRPHLEDASLVLLPAVLGLEDHGVHDEVTEALGCRVAEIPLPPPGVPGMRQNLALIRRARAARVRIINGSTVLGVETDGDRVTGIRINTAGSPRVVPCEHVALAPGGFESGALALDSYGRVTETLCGLPVRLPGDVELLQADADSEQPLFLAGLAVDDAMRVLDAEGHVVHPNLHAAGGILAGAIRWREKSGEGIALGSAVRAVAAIKEASC